MRTLYVILLCVTLMSAARSGPFEQLPEVRTVSIDVSGMKLSARLYPARNMPTAAIVLLHGWNWPHNDPATGLVSPAREFQRAGFTVLVPSMRGWPPSGGVDDCAGRQVDDALLALEWLGQQPGVDADRRYLAGFSQGGQVALLAASHYAPVQAVAAFAPVVDPGSWGRQTNVDGVRDYVMQECGGPTGWQTRNVMNRANTLQQPLLLVHGDADLRVPTQQSISLYEKLVELQRPVKLQLITGAQHDQDKVLQTQLAIDFFEASALKTISGNKH
jgi:dipeptidyl aminopeptidase/acylaminoacyl peptidase